MAAIPSTTRKQAAMAVYQSLLFLHILAVVAWVGGMSLMHFAVRPSAVELLAPPQRLPLLAAVLGRFFTKVLIAIVALVISGAGMMHFLMAGGTGLPPSVHAMTTLAVIMMAIFGHVRMAAYPRLRRAVAAQDWPLAGTALTTIRRLVLLNLVLGVITIAVATIGRALVM